MATVYTRTDLCQGVYAMKLFSVFLMVSASKVKQTSTCSVYGKCQRCAGGAHLKVYAAHFADQRELHAATWVWLRVPRKRRPSSKAAHVWIERGGGCRALPGASPPYSNKIHRRARLLGIFLGLRGHAWAIPGTTSCCCLLLFAVVRK